MKNLKEVEGVRRKHCRPEPVLLDGGRFDWRPGERIGLVGPNGCGKTTLYEDIGGPVRSRTAGHAGSIRPCTWAIWSSRQNSSPAKRYMMKPGTAVAALMAPTGKGLAVAQEMGQRRRSGRAQAPGRRTTITSSAKLPEQRRLQSGSQDRAGAGRLGICTEHLRPAHSFINEAASKTG